ncbi:hypothetical protein B0J18DRAFT_427476 [Chaetomium sp. MPI-SDFR-AT-0129]|nr:hypothetical protein B0J18DRAFT_427476 [Chaetomium sp. MPI-SDFR-AT-0129]
MPFTLTQVTVADGPALAANNIPAFWADPHWRLEWRHRTLEYHISQVALRYPRTLIRNPDSSRHQKAVGVDTGEVLGYARWSIPVDAVRSTADGKTDRSVEGGEGVGGVEQGEGQTLVVWPEAMVPRVTPEEEAEIQRVAGTAVWDPDGATDPLLEPARKIEEEILARKTYMRLDYLAVHPKHQRQGVATALVRSGLEQADKLGLDVFVRAMKPGVPVYQRLGFRLERELIQDDSEYGGPGDFGDYFLVYEQSGKGDSDEKDAP